MLNIFKKTNEHGNYPKPKHMSNSEMEKRIAYNREQVFKEIYVPNKELENLVGCSLLDKNPKIKRELTDIELERALDLASIDFISFAIAGRDFVDAFKPVHEQYMVAQKAYLKECAKNKEKRETLIGDDTIFSMQFIKDIYDKAREARRIEMGTRHYAEEENWNREQKIKSLQTHLDVRSMYRVYFSSIAACLPFTRNNLHGASVPLYEIY